MQNHGNHDLDGEDGMERANAYIRQIRLSNFMCHEHLALDFSPHLNIIYGMNGSGKSTILTGIMIGLGAKSHTTSRGSNLSAFIKTGKQKAWIHITINLNPRYHTLYEKYGEAVTITRVLRSGVSSLEIRNESGVRVPGPTARDVAEICSYCGFYPNNELAMLSQENAKEFLVTATARKKYYKLKEAMQQLEIEKAQLEIASSEDKRKEMVKRMETRRKELELSEEKNREIVTRGDRQSNSKQKLDNIKKVIRWREIRSFKENLDAAERIRDAAVEKLSDVQSPEELAAKVAECQAKYNELCGTQSELEAKQNDLGKALDGVRSKYETSKLDLESAENDRKGFVENLERKQIQVAQLKETNASTSWDALEARRVEIEEQIGIKQKERIRLSDELRNLSAQCSEKVEQVNQATNEFRSVNAQQSSLENQIRDKREEIKNADLGTSSVNNRTPGYQRQQRLKRAVQQAGRWRDMPIGPIYDYLEVRDEGVKFLPAIERLLNRTIESWWVTNREDGHRLRQIANQLNIDVTVIEREDDPYDLRNIFPAKSNDYLRLIDILSAKSDSIIRLLIDKNSIDSMAFCEDINNGDRIARTTKGVNRVIALTLRGHEKTFTVLESNAFTSNSSSLSPWNDVRISVSKQALKEALREQLKSYQQELEESSSVLRDLESQRQELSYQKKKMDQQEQAVESSVVAKQKEISDLTVELQKIQDTTQLADNEAEIADLEAQIAHLKEDIGAISETIEMYLEKDTLECQHEFETARDAFNESERTYNELLRSIEAARRKHQQLQRENRDANNHIRALQSELETAEANVRTCKIDLDNMKNQITEEVGELDESIEKVRILMGQNIMTLQNSITELEADLQVNRASADEVENAQREIDNNENRRRELTESEQIVKHFHEKLSQYAYKRRENSKRVWENAKRRIQEKFVAILRSRGFNGAVKIDDDPGSLDAQAAPQSQENRGTSTLSGGEKSFVQIALLMSVWETMNIGLTALDEYDVYMDKTNRSASLLALAQTTRRNGMQCVLITPQDVDTSAVDGTVDFQVHRMRPARRATSEE